MTNDKTTEIIRLRHRLLAMTRLGTAELHGEANQVLDRFRLLSEQLGEPELLSEHSRWSVHLQLLAH